MKKLSFFGFLLIACIIALAVSFVACNETVLAPAETIPEIIETDIATITPETAVAPETIKDIKVDETIVGGKTVYRRA